MCCPSLHRHLCVGNHERRINDINNKHLSTDNYIVLAQLVDVKSIKNIVNLNGMCMSVVCVWTDKLITGTYRLLIEITEFCQIIKKFDSFG